MRCSWSPNYNWTNKMLNCLSMNTNFLSSLRLCCLCGRNAYISISALRLMIRENQRQLFLPFSCSIVCGCIFSLFLDVKIWEKISWRARWYLKISTQRKKRALLISCFIKIVYKSLQRVFCQLRVPRESFAIKFDKRIQFEKMVKFVSDVNMTFSANFIFIKAFMKLLPSLC